MCVYVSETLRQNASKRIICNVRASQRRVDRAVCISKNVSAIVNSAVHARVGWTNHLVGM